MSRYGLALALGFTLLLAACGADPPRRTRTWITVAWPADAPVAGRTLLPSRNGVAVWGFELSAVNPGLWSLRVPGEAPFDLQAAILTAAIPEPADRSIQTVGRWQGHLQGVEPGSRGRVLRFRPLEAHDLGVAVRDPDDRPVAGARVFLRFLTDWVEAATDAAGRVELADVPARAWHMEVSPPARSPRASEEGRVLAATTRRVEVAGPTTVSVVLPPARPVRVCAPGIDAGATLLRAAWTDGPSVQVLRWRPDEAGCMVLHVDPAATELRLGLLAEPDANGRSRQVLERTVSLAGEGPVTVELGR